MNDKTEQSVTDELIDQIESTARASFRRHQGSIKGQLLTAADTYDWHLLHAAYQAGIHAMRAQLAEAQRDAEVNRQINRACAELPDDYRIVIEIERDAGWVCLLRGGEDMDFDDPCEGVASRISAAIDAAKGGGGNG